MTASRVHTIEGIVLKRKNVGEGDRIITIFSKEHGKIRVIARGIRKITSHRAPHLEVFTRIRAVIHDGKSISSVSEVETLDAFAGIRADLTKVSIAYYATELVDSLTPEAAEQADIYLLLTGFLESLPGTDTPSLYRISTTFTLTVLHTLGFLPEGKKLVGSEIPPFIESITERKMKSAQFARLLIKSNGSS